MISAISWNLLLYNLLSAISSILLDGNQMVAVNLPIMLASVAAYVLAFYLNYFRHPGTADGVNTIESGLKRRGLAGMAVRLAASVLFGMVHVSIAVGLSCHHLLLAVGYVKEVAKRNTPMRWLKPVADVLYLAAPPLLVALLLAVGGDLAFVGIVPVVVSVLLHVHWGKRHVKIPASAYFGRYEWNLGRRIPSSVQYALLTALVLFVAIPMLGLAVANGSFIDNGYLLLVDVFDPARMCLVNLPIVAGSRLVFLKLRRNHLHANEKQGQGIGQERGVDVDDRMRRIHVMANNFTIILAGALVVPVALAVGTHSLLLSALYALKLRGTPPARGKAYVLVICASIPLAFLASALVYPVAFILATGLPLVGTALVLAAWKGKSVVGLTRAQLAQQLKPQWRKVTVALEIALLVYGFGMPAILISGNLGGAPPVEHYMLEMEPDGTHLATDVYFSQLVGRQPAPVILVRTPYGKNETGLLYASIYTAQGYHVVVQDFRGTHESEGGSDFLIFTKDITDAPETIAWIRAQPWCNGKVGSVGASALCITQYLYAGMNPEGLLAQSFWFGTPDLIEDAILEGAFHQGLVEYWLEGVAHDNWRKQIDIIFAHMANLSMLDGMEARSITLGMPPNVYSNVTTRGIHVGGFYDHFLRGTIRGFTNFDDHGAPRARGHQKMVIGPWTHVAVMGGRQGELAYPASSNGLGMLLDWETEIFDESFLGTPASWDGNRVAYYLMGDVDDPSAGANYWKFAPDWPINNSCETWYLGVDAGSNKVITPNESSLQGGLNLSYLYDPCDPIYTRGGNNEPSYTEKGAGPYDQRPVETVDEAHSILRDDLLLFQSDVIRDPITFEGELKARLHVSSNCTDTDFMVKLCDVYPDGRRMLIIDSALTTRFHVNKSSENFLVPGQEYVIDVDLIATAYKFNKGHRIAVTIQSSNYDRYAINPNTGGPITDHFAEGFVANNTIITGPGKSCIYFPRIA
ncbi:MAG: CocE/NonD family hydrolase [Candidatus Lokiarchaeota archaeon]|nr:CocE/NonD family hydrolase [Candidatus Lokiarchaeota archaeon]